MKKEVMVHALFDFGSKKENGGGDYDSGAAKDGGVGHGQNEYRGTSE
jgi:hypothetical protein